MNRRLRIEIEFIQRTTLTRTLRIDADGFVPAARPNLIQVRSMPKRQMINRRLFRALSLVKPSADPAAAYPNRIALKTQAISSRHRSTKLSPTVTPSVAEN